MVREEEKATEVELEAVQVEVAKDEAAKEVEATEAARAATRVEGSMADEVADWAEAGKVVVREGETASAPRPERTW